VNGTTFIVGEHNDEIHPETVNGVFERADDGLGNCLSRIPNNEQVTETDIEDKFSGNARIGTSKQRGERLLSGHERIAPIDILPRVRGMTRDESVVTCD
jgi:hypothetical protein